MQNKLSIKNLQAAAFDWDNTLANSRETLVFAINKILPQYNLPQWETVQAKRNRCLSFKDNFPLIFGNKAEEAYKKYSLIYKENVKNMISAPDKAKEVLEFLKNNGIKIVIVSNKDRELFEFEKSFLYDSALFDRVVCGHEAAKDKPDAAQLEFAVRGYVERITPETVWMTGDSPMDSECALAAGARAIRIGKPIWSGENDDKDKDILFMKDFCQLYKELTEQNGCAAM